MTSKSKQPGLKKARRPKQKFRCVMENKIGVSATRCKRQCKSCKIWSLHGTLDK